MPSSNVGDTAPSSNQYHTRSHDPDRYAGQGPYARPQQQSTTQPELHRSSSRGPRGGNSERATRAITTASDESGSRSRADLKGPPSDSYSHSNDPKDAGGPTERTRAISVSSSSGEDFEMIEKQKRPSSSKRDNVSRSSTKDDSNTGSRNTERKSYSQVIFDQSLASIKSLDNTGPRLPQAPAVNPETKPIQFGSLPPKQTVSNLPRAPTDNVSTLLTTQNIYPASLQSTITDDSILPSVINATNHAKALPAATHGPSPDSLVTLLPGSDATQQPRSVQHQQQQGESKGGLTGLLRNAWSGSSGTSPKDRAIMEERYQYESQIINLQADLKRFSKEHRNLKQKHLELEHENSRLKDNNNGLQHELISIQRELGEAKSLSEIRGKELMGAQVFLTKADSLSMSDVIDKVGILNDEIFQTAALFAEGLHHKKHELPQESLQTLYEQSCPIIGEYMTRLLRTQSQINEANPDVNPLLAQAVVSTHMVHFCTSKLTSWYPSDPKISEFLTLVYSQMRQSEDQAVYGRWRSLLHAQTRPSNDGWRSELTNQLDKILKLACWDAPSEVKRGFESKLGPIFKALEDVRIALYEKFTSADLEAFSVEPSGPFQSWMEDAYGDGRQAQGNLERTEIVVGTTGIGLKRFIIVRSESGESRDAFESVIPPKVVLESTLKEALDPPPPTRKSRKRGAPEDGGR